MKEVSQSENILFTHDEYPRGKKFLVFSNEAITNEGGTIALKQVLGVCDEDADFLTLLWDTGEESRLTKQERLLCVPYDDPFWRGEILRQWWYLLNGEKKFFVAGFKDDGIICMGPHQEYDEDNENDEDDEEEKEEFNPGPIMPGQIDFLFTRHQYPDDPVDEQSITFYKTTFVKPSNSLAHFTSFADVLIHLFARS